ncbi:MAG: polysaccharide pyruvyl transferase family protein [Sulfurovaceae bacterium]|nr:polysaccharide pyruvyl transferase family protein [Sulfurovaceae bacterium]
MKITKTVVINDTSYEAHHGCQTVMNNIFKLLKLQKIEILATNPVARDWNHKEFIDNLKKADIVIINGEGTLHHSQKRAKILSEIIPFSKNLNKKVILINATIEDNDEYIMNNIRLADLIFVRESMSHNYLLKKNIQSTVVPDMTFYTDIVPKHREKKYIAYTDSVYNELSIELLNESRNRTDAIFIPPLKLTSFDKSIKIFFRDRLKWILFKIINMLKIDMEYERLIYLYFTNNFNDYLDKLYESKLLIAGRFHSICFGILTQTPFVALKSNSFKVEGLLKDIGMENRLYDKVENIPLYSNLEFNPTEIKKIDTFIKKSKADIEKMFKLIGSI